MPAPVTALAKIAAATATGGGNNIRDGKYKKLIEKFTHQKGHSGETIIVEFRVISSEAVSEYDPMGKPVVPNAVGSSCSMVCLLDKHPSAPGNAKQLLIAALQPLGYTEAQITEELIATCASERNPLRGIAVVNETIRKTNKGRDNPANAGKPLTLNKFSPIAQSKEDIAAQRAWLDGNAATVEVATAPQTTSLAAQSVAPAPAVGGMLAALGLK